MVASSQPLASQAGSQILSIGGNAADAAVAAAAALAVTEPTSTGIGGDCFALYFDARSGIITALNGSGRAPAKLNLALLAEQGYAEEIPPFHPHTVTVPGACAGWCDLINSHGRLPLEDVLTPAIQLAENGFPVSPITAYFWKKGVENQLSKSPGGLELTIDGRAPNPGEIFRNPNFARTLQSIAEKGPEAFYLGEIADAIVSVIRSAGGVLDKDDLASHHSTWEEPISTTYRGYQIWLQQTGQNANRACRDRHPTTRTMAQRPPNPAVDRSRIPFLRHRADVVRIEPHRRRDRARRSEIHPWLRPKLRERIRRRRPMGGADRRLADRIIR